MPMGVAGGRSLRFRTRPVSHSSGVCALRRVRASEQAGVSTGGRARAVLGVPGTGGHGGLPPPQGTRGGLLRQRHRTPPRLARSRSAPPWIPRYVRRRDAVLLDCFAAAAAAEIPHLASRAPAKSIRAACCSNPPRDPLKKCFMVPPGHPPIRLDKYRDEWDSQMIEEVWYGSSGCPSDCCALALRRARPEQHLRFLWKMKRGWGVTCSCVYGPTKTTLRRNIAARPAGRPRPAAVAAAATDRPRSFGVAGCPTTKDAALALRPTGGQRRKEGLRVRVALPTTPGGYYDAIAPGGRNPPHRPPRTRKLTLGDTPISLSV
ncbi:hypothetical protein HPB47_024043 [Ixodes persulcatus]|uniref:Uncharacterized protein n=1 Tax=Ixodes persulcatus TaxID=34615 RepID=A0AC60Q5G9_IXOPE|nr:hypothetical protein HPB47_024043 [Ixodes persulcatus]